MSEKRFSLKDHLFNKEKVEYLSGLLDVGIPHFDRAGFQREVMAELPKLELKERISHISQVVAGHLHPEFVTAVDQIRASLPPPLDPNRSDGDFGDFIIAPLGEYVATHGLDYFDVSMELLRELTMRFSMEGPVRVFLDAYPVWTLDLFREWATDSNYHVRRLVSESTRPRLPWAPRIHIGVTEPLPLLHLLHADPTRYVTRSVANHLNDIAKVDHELVLATLREWRTRGRQDPEELEWMTRHGLRTLVKQGHPGALGLLGYSPQPDVDVRIVRLSVSVRAGGTLEFTVNIEAKDDARLLVDYVIGFVKRNGGTNPKVFRLRQLSMSPGQSLDLTKKHVLKADATTYRLYPGRHELTVVANGTAMASGQFELRL